LSLFLALNIILNSVVEIITYETNQTLPDSTNEFLKGLSHKQELDNFTVVIKENKLKERQMGSTGRLRRVRI
jgi:hypothetical protein